MFVCIEAHIIFRTDGGSPVVIVCSDRDKNERSADVVMINSLSLIIKSGCTQNIFSQSVTLCHALSRLTDLISFLYNE